jgi:hypothetical protein
MRNIYPLILVCILMVGCLTAAQRQALSIRQNAQAANERAIACLRNITTNPGYQQLAKHAPLDTRINPTLEQLADKEVPTNEDVQIIIAFHNELAQCRERIIEDLMNVIPGIIPIVVQGYHQADLITVDLMERKLSWGEANKKRTALRDDVMGRFQVALAQLERELAASHQAELVQRQAAFNALAQWAYQQQVLIQNQQAINNLNRPVVTTCSGYGYSVRCISH